MKYFIALTLLISGVTLSASIVCPANYCDHIDCSQYGDTTPEQCTNGEIKQNGSFCGCCPICVKHIPIGGSCAHLHLRGTPRTSMCEPSSKCVDGLCVVSNNSDHDSSENSDSSENVEVAEEIEEPTEPPQTQSIT